MGRSHQVRGAAAGFDASADDSGCRVLHVDMDAFYASVEVRRRPEWAGRPVIVGGLGPRGVVSSASYEARGYGVRSAMPIEQARRLCPRAVFLPPDFAAYAEASRAVMAIFSEITPLVEPISTDEAFLDVSGAIRLMGPPATIAAGIRARVRAEQELVCSVGVAATKFVAKLASAQAKPDGVVVVSAQRTLEFLHPLPVEALWGVGERTAQALHRLGLRRIVDLANAPVGMIRHALGAAAASHLHELSWGRDPRVVNPRRVEKSVSAETTFDVDIDDVDDIRRTILTLATKVAARLRRSGQVGRTVAIKVRLADFRTLSRSHTLATGTDVSREIFSTSWALFHALSPGDRIRLIGVRVEGLIDAEQVSRQLRLGEPERGWREADVAVDAASSRFGPGVVRPASLLRADRSATTRPN